MDLQAENPHLAHLRRRVSVQGRRGRGDLRRQGQEPAQPGALLFPRGALGDAKTGTLMREAVDVDYILVDNEKEALALENNLIKQ